MKQETIKIKKIPAPRLMIMKKVREHANNVQFDNFEDIGKVNFLELLNFRVEIRKQKATGYYVLEGKTLHEIDSDGRFVTVPKFLDEYTNYLRKLLAPNK